MSTTFLGRDEKLIREGYAHYHNGYSKIGRYMFGKLILTNKRFMFQWQESVAHGGFLGFGKKQEMQTRGTPINIPIDKLTNAVTETRTRKKNTLNEPATLFSKEQYQVLIVSMDTPDGSENPVFEVENVQDWQAAISRAVGGETVQF
jgi:hypothetical protein